MGKNLSLTVVAQGVETSEQAEFMRVHACDEFQGFYFNRPLPPEEFTELLLLTPANEIAGFGNSVAEVFCVKRLLHEFQTKLGYRRCRARAQYDLGARRLRP
jgi:hypothetical protein